MTSKTFAVFTFVSVFLDYVCYSGAPYIPGLLPHQDQQRSPNVTVTAGGRATLSCNQTPSTADRFVEWRQRKDVGGVSSWRDVYKNVSIQPAFAGRFSVQRLSRGSCSLVVDNVQPVDSAVYKCLCGIKCEYRLIVTSAAAVDQATSVYQFVDSRVSVIYNVPYIVLTVFILAVLAVWCAKYLRRCRRCRRHAKFDYLQLKKREHKDSVRSANNDSRPNSPLLLSTPHHEVLLSSRRNDTWAQWTDVFGIAELNGNVYVAMRESDVILSFPAHARDDSPRHIRVSGLREPHDIVACTETNQLFVADGFTSGCVTQITFGCETGGNSPYKPLRLPTCEFRRDEPTINKRSAVTCSCSLPVGCQARKFRFAEPRREMYLRPVSLSIRKRRLLTICKDNLLLYELKMNYVDEAEEITCISVLGKMPEHALETANETFVVSCNTRPQPKLLEMNFRGVELRDFVVGNLARYLLSCSDTAFLVADEFGHRVVHIDWSTKAQTVLFDETNDELRNPWRMCRVESSQQLIVAGHLSKNFHYFDVGTCDLCNVVGNADC